MKIYYLVTNKESGIETELFPTLEGLCAAVCVCYAANFDEPSPPLKTIEGAHAAIKHINADDTDNTRAIGFQEVAHSGQPFAETILEQQHGEYVRGESFPTTSTTYVPTAAKVAANFTTPCCSHCGGTDVKRDAWAIWDGTAQDWVISSVNDAAWCETCQDSIWIDWKEA